MANTRKGQNAIMKNMRKGEKMSGVTYLQFFNFSFLRFSIHHNKLFEKKKKILKKQNKTKQKSKTKNKTKTKTKNKNKKQKTKQIY